MVDLSAVFLVLDKLILEKRYNEVIKFYDDNLIAHSKLQNIILAAITLSLLKIVILISSFRIYEFSLIFFYLKEHKSVFR